MPGPVRGARPAASEDPGVVARSQPPDAAAPYQHDLAETARAVWESLPDTDVAAAVDAATLDGGPEEGGHETARATAQAAAQIQRQGPPPASDLRLDWHAAGLGGVLPVLPASPGAGATVVATALADSLQLLSWRILLVDTADPARSGLGYATEVDGPMIDGPHDAVRIRLSWRGRALLARAHTTLPVLAPGMLPPPPLWAPPKQLGTAEITVVDLSYDAWRLAADPLSGPGMWLRAGQPHPRPILVVRPTRPSLRQAEQVLARLERWIEAGVTVAPAALVVVGAKKWPDGVVGTAGRRVSALLNHTFFLPWESTVETGGITPEVTPARLRAAIAPLLRAWKLAPEQRSRSARRFGRGGPR